MQGVSIYIIKVLLCYFFNIFSDDANIIVMANTKGAINSQFISLMISLVLLVKSYGLAMNLKKQST